MQRVIHHANQVLSPTVGAGSANGGAGGGVTARLYTKSQPRERADLLVKQASPSGASLRGIRLPAVSGSTWQFVLVLITGMLMIGLLFSHELGLGPRAWARAPRASTWRPRWMRRLPWSH